jgi:SAM-dependent methyltransferase
MSAASTERERRPGEDAIRTLYEWKPYPGLGAQPKKSDNWLLPIQDRLPRRVLRYLDAGCGTGHSVVGMAKARPEWQYCAVDISRPSLDIAAQLARKHGVQIDFREGSYLDPLPFDGPFDLIASFGSIVVCEDPVRAVRNLLGYLAEDGIMMLWLYGREGEAPRMVTKAILDTFEPDVFRHEQRFQLYREMRRKRRRGPIDILLDFSLRSVLRLVRDRLRSDYDRKQRFDYNYVAPDQLWADYFCLPFEHHYDVGDVKELAEAAGLDVFLLTEQGREDLDLLPDGWHERYDKLDKWSKWRLMELLSHGRPRSMRVYGRRSG